MTPGLPPRRRRELPAEALRPAHSVPTLRTRGRLRLVRQPVRRRAASPLVALVLAVSAHAGLAWWGLGGAGSSALPVAVRDVPGAALAVSLDLTRERPTEPWRRAPSTPLEQPAPLSEPEASVDGLIEPAERQRTVDARPPLPLQRTAASWSLEAAGAPPAAQRAEPAAQPEALQSPADPVAAVVDPAPVLPVEPVAEDAGVSSPAGQTTRPEPRADNPAPRYPAVARRRGWEGRVVVRVQVGAEGTVQHGEIARSSGRNVLDQAALTAVLAWRFEPARDGRGAAVPGEREVSVRFQLGVGA